MERFAHVFEAHDRQVLVRRGVDSDENPAINLITEIQGAELSFNLVFHPDDQEEDREFSYEKAEAARDRAFLDVDTLRKAAEGFAKQLEGAESPMDALRLLSGK
ncbi:hypothetical protein sortsyn_24 [Escherichia phage sortsyn]|uniref:Uncharacterized protein n=1 Tax=Escherichia phage sortsyn TaxID=2696447 RepID=A0A6B9XB58_9CAUD|nr:hypothetical protein sortsyn_24 [Escherichia phage sortsyn]